MKPITPFDNFPSFANGGSRSAPGDAKYALGFVAADTFPAEWANYFFHGATKGVSDLNSAVYSMWNEMGSVLSNYNITPDATDNDQLLEALTKLKAEAALAAHPVGSLYWTSSSENPATTFGGGTWTRIKDKFILAAGDTYSNGNTGGAATVTLTSDQIPSHRHSFTPAGSVSVTTNPTFTGSEHSHSYTPAGSVSVTTNPTFTGSEHSHSYTPAGSVTGGAYKFTGSAVNTGGMSANSTHSHSVYRYRDFSGSATTWFYGGDNKDKNGNIGQYPGGVTDTKDLSHTHSVTAAGTVSVTTNPTFSGTAATLKATQGGTISGGTYKFTGTAATLKATQGGTISGGAYSFTGTASNTGYTGGGNAHNNMPPYIVKYCWERTA